MSPRTFLRPVPLYVQIADRLREKVAELGSGSQIPSEPKLAKDWGVSRFTIARAAEQLVEEGLIVRRQGRGTFVAEAPLRYAPGYLLSFTEAVEAAGHEASHRLLSFEPTQWRPGLPYPEDANLVLVDRLRYVDGEAVARHRSILSADLLERIGLTEAIIRAANFSLYAFFDRCGLQVHRADERFAACLANDDDRAQLNLGDCPVVVAVTRHTFAADGSPLDVVDAVYDARRYSYEAHLVRQRQNEPNNPEESSSEYDIDIQRGHIGPRLGPWNSTGNGS